MKRSSVVLLLFLLLFFSVNSITLAFAEVALIANKSITVSSVNIKEAKKIFLGKTKSLDGGGKVQLADLPVGNPARKEFYANVVKKKESQLKAYWAKKSFTGKGFPPKELATEADVVDWVAETRGAVGYVSSGSVNDTVNVLLKK